MLTPPVTATYNDSISGCYRETTMSIVGRKIELKFLNKILSSKESEFISVFGRRRVGKTYLIREFFSNKKCLFLHCTGIQNGKLAPQLENFSEAISKTFFDEIKLGELASWHEAFKVLNTQILKSKEKVVIFLDELPWLASPKSGILQEIDYYWNHHWSALNNVVLIVCGSSASWLIKNIIHNKGGLHNRITGQLKLAPFDLNETADFLISRQIKLSNKHVLSLYMTLGGIPYYLKYVERGLTAEENIQKILFDQSSPLKDEFQLLFKSLFNDGDSYIELIKIISKNREGVPRAVLKTASKLSTDGGRLTKRLNDLCHAGFIEEYIPWNKERGAYYKLIDEFCLFYLYWIKPNKRELFIRDYWITQSQMPAYSAWSGYAFEAVCMKHISQIIKALEIKSSGTVSSWRHFPKKHMEKGAQIDLLIDRNDDAISVCEIKYTDKPFVIDKNEYEKLKRKVSIFKLTTETKKQIFLSLISAAGVKANKYRDELIDSTITLDDLFKNCT
jgi:AAA+ ATPase superfamily predicted ATPase